MLPQPRGVFLQFKLFAPGFAANRVIQIAGLLAGEKDHLDLFLTFAHRVTRLPKFQPPVCQVDDSNRRGPLPARATRRGVRSRPAGQDCGRREGEAPAEPAARSGRAILGSTRQVASPSGMRHLNPYSLGKNAFVAFFPVAKLAAKVLVEELPG